MIERQNRDLARVPHKLRLHQIAESLNLGEKMRDTAVRLDHQDQGNGVRGYILENDLRLVIVEELKIVGGQAVDDFAVAFGYRYRDQNVVRENGKVGLSIVLLRYLLWSLRRHQPGNTNQRQQFFTHAIWDATTRHRVSPYVLSAHVTDPRRAVSDHRPHSASPPHRE